MNMIHKLGVLLAAIHGVWGQGQGRWTSEQCVQYDPRSVTDLNRMTGGLPAYPSQVRFLSSVGVDYGYEHGPGCYYYHHLCNGVNINEGTVLTAGFCAFKEGLARISPYYYQMMNELPPQFNVESVQLHPDQDPNDPFKAQLALIQSKDAMTDEYESRDLSKANALPVKELCNTVDIG